MAFNLHTSNRLDLLAGQLAAVMAEPPEAAPLAPEIIVVQSRGIERWLSLRISRALGICANCRFPFPNQFFRDTASACLPGLPDTAAFEREALAWRIMELLPGLDGPGPAAYLRGDTGLKLYQLACRTADLFDQYAVYRPDMLAAWEAGRLCHAADAEEQWQARLWRGLAGQERGAHRGRLLDEFLSALDRTPSVAAALPGRVSVFGIAVLPPYHVRFFEALAAHLDVHLFLLNPCREYWGDILTAGQAARLARRRGRQGGPASQQDDLHLTSGNSLLAAFGAYGREFHELILSSRELIEQELFAAGTGTSILACIQDDILTLRDRGAAGDTGAAVSGSDRSLQVHACHSPMREVEVLQDALLGFFESTPGLAPHDILVMTPDLATYGPFVQAVFGAPESESARIPFSMADRSFLEVYPLYDAVLQLLDLGQSRFGAPQVLQLLELPAVLQRFGLCAGDVELIRGWVTQTRIRWGKDADCRLRVGLPACNDNTWQAGLERLLLGYALPGDGELLFRGVLPSDAAEGGPAQALGKFAHFMEALFAFSERLQGEKTLAEWSRLLLDLLSGFFSADSEDAARMLDEARQVCAGLGSMQELAGFSGAVKPEIIREHLKKAFSLRTTTAGFLTGAVTVCAMLPMRSIPFRIICLIGMNDGIFPRSERPPAFDLIARYGRPCDRSAKKDDRYLFLETLISAGETLYISYTGQNVSDNAVIPPSTLVSQLLDYVEQGFTCCGRSMRDQVLTRHRLQPFSPGYFTAGTGLSSYSLRNFGCAQEIRKAGRAELPQFFSGELPAPDEASGELAIEDLCDFFANPCRYLLQKRLGIYFSREQGLIGDREPFELAGIDRYGFEQELLASRLAGAEAAALLPAVRARGVLPHGIMGEIVYESCSSKLDKFLEQLAACACGSESFPVSVPVGRFCLSGTLTLAAPGTLQIISRYGRARTADFFRAWVQQLVLAASGRSGETRLLALHQKTGAPALWSFSSPGDPRGLLSELVELYRQGLRSPLPLFPQASYAYAEKLCAKNCSRREALQSALEAFEGTEHARGDGQDPYINLCFRSGEFNTEAFAALATAAYRDMFAQRKAAD